MEKKVNLFFVGWPKTASTWFYRLFYNLNEVLPHPVKEPNYFCPDIKNVVNEFNKRRDRKIKFGFDNYQEYYSYFKFDLARYKSARYLADFSVIYIFSEKFVELLKEYNENAKIVIGIREPVDYILSYYFHLLRERMEIIPLKRALELEKYRKNWKNNFHLFPLEAINPIIYFYSFIMDYYNHIKKILKSFSIEDDVFIYLFEEFKKDNELVLKELSQFLNVKIPKNLISTLRNSKINRNIVFSNNILRKMFLVFPGKMKRSKFYVRWVSTRFPKFDDKITHFYYKTINLLFRSKEDILDKNFSKLTDFESKEELKEFIYKKYNIKISKLANLIDKDLETIWGYENV